MTAINGKRHSYHLSFIIKSTTIKIMLQFKNAIPRGFTLRNGVFGILMEIRFALLCQALCRPITVNGISERRHGGIAGQDRLYHPNPRKLRNAFGLLKKRLQKSRDRLLRVKFRLLLTGAAQRINAYVIRGQ